VSQDVTVTVAPVTATASADVTTTCAGDPVELSVVAGGGGPFSYVWSDGTNTVGTAAEITVNPTTTTTYTVTVTDVCNNSISDQVTITVNPLPMVSIEEVGPIDICAPGTQVLTANTTTPNPEYQWQNNGVDIDGETSSTLTVTTTGNYSVLVTETSTGCVGSSTAVAVNINPLPVITSVTGPSAVCDGSSATLTAKSEFFETGDATLGTNTTSTSTTGVSPFSAGWEAVRTQYLIRASELQAVNLAAGDISALAFFVTTGYSSIMKDYTLKIAHTNATALGTAYESGSFSTVYGPVDYASGTTANAWRTLDFDTPFTWDGTSNIIVEICFETDPDGSCGTCYGSTSTVRYTATSYNSVYARYADNSVACGSTTFGSAQTSGRTFRPNMQFTGTVIDNQTPNFTWEWNPGALTGSSVSVTPTTQTTYTVVATNTTTGCQSAPQQITVDVTPALTVSADIVGPTNATAHVGSLPVATYSIATTNETSITWDIPVGSTNVSGQGTNTISFNYPVGYSGGSISVTVEGNSPCEPITRTLTITYDCPQAPVVSGPTNVCPFVGTSTEVTYTVAPDPGVSSYNWVVPPNVTIVSGQGTGSLTVTFQTGFTTQANKQIRVTGQSGCGNTAMTIYYLL
ncbi:MAG TPA: hypothetical protein PLY79_11065, partial [Ferruginibacter sp.]|nr:hypothetical protein [Ferruginibacter sp.]